MSWRQNIPEIEVSPYLNDITNTVGNSALSLQSERQSFNEELKFIQVEVISILNSIEPNIPSMLDEKSKEFLIDVSIESGDSLNDIINETARKDLSKLPIFVVERVTALRNKANEIVGEEIPKIIFLERFLRSRYAVVKTLSNAFERVLSGLAGILGVIENLIQSVATTPIIGPLLQSILNLIKDIIEEKLYYPLKNSVNEWKKSIASLENVLELKTNN